MKVLVLSCATYADPSTRRVWDRVAERGVEVTLALPRRVKHPFGPAVVPDTPWPTPGVRLVKLATWRVHENGTHVVMKGIPRLIRETRPDIIHCVMEPWSITCLEALACIAFMRPRPRFGVQACETKPEQGGLLAGILRKRLYASALARCDYFIGWSEPVVRAARRMGLNGQVTGVAPAVGVDTELFRPAEPGERARLRAGMDLWSPDDFVVGFVGRFVHEKGVMDLLAAFDRASATMPRARLVFLGSGPLGPELESAARTRPWMKVLRPLDQPGVARFMRALDLLALPSRTTTRWEEQFGLVLPQAMASGVPVLGSDSGAIPEVVGNAGWVVCEQQPPLLAEVIANAANGSNEARSRGLRGLERSEMRFADLCVSRALLETWSQAHE